MTNAQLKSEIKKVTGLKVMVRDYNKRLKTSSVWLFPADRNSENESLIKSLLVDLGFKRVDGYNMPITNLISVNSGEFNALKLF